MPLGGPYWIIGRYMGCCWGFGGMAGRGVGSFMAHIDASKM